MDGCLVISAGEGRENVLEAGSYCLTEAERTLPEQVTSRFERTVVVVGSGNVTDLSRAGELGVSPLLLAWPGGRTWSPTRALGAAAEG